MPALQAHAPACLLTRRVQEQITPLIDAQLLEPVKFPFGDRTVTRATFWQRPLCQIRNHHG